MNTRTHDWKEHFMPEEWGCNCPKPDQEAPTSLLTLGEVAEKITECVRKMCEGRHVNEYALLEGMWMAMQLTGGTKRAIETVRYGISIDGAEVAHG